MTIIPIQVTDEGVVIPKAYLHNADEVEVEMTAEYVIVRPKGQQAEPWLRDKPVHIYSPRLVNQSQIKDFAMEVSPES